MSISLKVGCTYEVTEYSGIDGYSDESGEDVQVSVPRGTKLKYVGRFPDNPYGHHRFEILTPGLGQRIDIRPGDLRLLIRTK